MTDGACWYRNCTPVGRPSRAFEPLAFSAAQMAPPADAARHGRLRQRVSKRAVPAPGSFPSPTSCWTWRGDLRCRLNGDPPAALGARKRAVRRRRAEERCQTEQEVRKEAASHQTSGPEHLTTSLGSASKACQTMPVAVVRCRPVLREVPPSAPVEVGRARSRRP